MSLKTYRAKRKLKETPEPSGKKLSSKGGLIFVVQKHAARHLHYDLRLELDGVLKSWAVPKGPSLDPGVKRLAIEVEDHPIEYGSFEGTIPKGHYGAGEVIVWDHGTYAVPGKNKKEQEKLIREQLEKGDLKFTLFGQKLRGDFALIRLKNSQGKKNQWLLIKKKDEYQSDEDITKSSKSVVSDKSIQLSKENLGSSPKSSMPHKIKPMLAYLVDKPFNKNEWIFEIKWDGYRAIAEITPKKVMLYSRNQLSFNDKFPDIVKELQRLKGEMVLDGEVVILNKEGCSQFQLLQNYLRSHAEEGVLTYCVFDLLYYQGRDLRKLPLIRRKEMLKEIISSIAPSSLLFSDYIEENGESFFKEACKKGVEGIMAKEMNSPYLSVRSKYWLKIKTHQRQETVIGGFTQPRGSRKKFGALILGVYKDNVFTYVGHVGGGFNQRSLNEIYSLLEPLTTTKCPFKTPPKTNTQAAWVKPSTVCEVAFQEWTKEGIMRQPIFQGLRPDKKAKSVTQEKPLKVKGKSSKLESELPESKPKQKESGESKEINKTHSKHALEELITHPDKIYWPNQGYTKQNLLQYYETISPYILPHLKDRPIVLHRWPDGIEGGEFFQKEAPHFLPKWMQTVTVKHSNKHIHYILIEDLPSLLYVANLGSIEINPFLSRYQHIDKPEVLVLDIDPVDIPFEITIEVAQEIHQLLKKLGIDCYCKTSGKRGLHIYLPLNAKYDYPTVEQLAKLLATYIHQRLPEMTSLIRDPEKRQKKVYIDYMQNAKTKTVIAPYSVRAVEGATVSTPLEWKELKKGLDPHDFTIKTIPPRLKKKGDLFQAVLKKGISIPKILQKLEKVTTTG